MFIKVKRVFKIHTVSVFVCVCVCVKENYMIRMITADHGYYIPI